ncbi:polysaccharide deacetylase family protein [Pseudomonas entomophila]|uniref:polysaccharide deacetylase family protein n=1 Tax=Pseudomonas entomophila TaxID=312306 RepID=UPI002406C3C1|nr:polysaccharide deacetylase family protein [Pseudomonas entomophila]MDF9620524.1 polysaccharide deacetylase family protein [Pseudomonas entomophila]
MTSRRDFVKGTLVGGIAAAATGTVLTSGATTPPRNSPTPAGGGGPFWPNGAQLVISISLQFESGSQPAHAESPFPPLDARYPDTIAPSWYRYGPLEGVPRLLDLFDRHAIKVTSHMVGKAVEAYPELAAEVVRRGHEAAAHGLYWAPQYSLTPAEERRHYEQAAAIVERVTGQRPVGFNAFWMRHSRDTLNILQDLGFLYHIDDLSRDEPSITPVRGKPFVVVPYTLRNNDIGRIAGSTAMTGAALLQELKDEFDVLYAEGRQRRRLMSLSAHDRIGGTPTVAHALDQFIAYAKSHPGVAFLRKDEIARWTLAQGDAPLNPARVFD